MGAVDHIPSSWSPFAGKAGMDNHRSLTGGKTWASESTDHNVPFRRFSIESCQVVTPTTLVGCTGITPHPIREDQADKVRVATAPTAE
jgi:hypothetical protein